MPVKVVSRFAMMRLVGIFLALVSVAPASLAARTTTFLHTDGLGSVVAATSESGQVVWRKNYDAYGEQIDSAPNTEKLSYTGKEYDDVTGLTYFGARYYDPEVGRFMSPDPAGIRPDGPFTFNRYVYANANPYKFIDRDGRESACASLTGCNEWANRAPTPTQIGVAVDFLPGIGDGKGIYDAIKEPSAPNIIAAGVGLVPGGEIVGGIVKHSAKSVGKSVSKIFSKAKQALVDMAKADKRTGITKADMEAYKELNRELPDPFPTNKVRGPEAHDSGGPHSLEPHGHVGPVDHIPITDATK